MPALPSSTWAWGQEPLPLVRAWDDRIFQDTEERRARENAFVAERLESLAADCGAMLVVGQGRDRTDLLGALAGAVRARPGLPVVWVEEDLGDDPDAAGGPLADHDGLVRVRVAGMETFLDAVAADDSHGLWFPNAAASGIDRSGSPGSYTYSVLPGREDEPHAFIIDVSRSCFGDLDGDGDVDLGDLAILLSNYGTTSGAAPEDGDLDGDGDVDLGDLAAILSVYGAVCP